MTSRSLLPFAIVVWAVLHGVAWGEEFPQPSVADPAHVLRIPVEQRQWFRNPDGSCLAPETPVSTTAGLVPICKLRTEVDAILYLAADGKIRATNRYRPWITKKADTLTTIIAGGRIIRMTPDHRVGTLAKSVRYVAAGSLSVGAPVVSTNGTVEVESVSTATVPLTPVWDLENLEDCWQGEGNFFANGILVHNCVQCSNGMAGMQLNVPQFATLLWDTDYGPKVRGGSWPGRVAEYAKSRGVRIYNVTGANTWDWMRWACATGRPCAIGAGGSHFQTLAGYEPASKKWFVCNNNSPQKIDEYSDDGFRRLHLASGQWCVILDYPATAASPQYAKWW